MNGIWDAKLARIERVPLFAGCDRRTIRWIGRLGDGVALPPGAILAREGRASGEVLVIVEGTAEVSRRGQAFAALGPGDLVGGSEALDAGHRATTVTTTSPVELLVFDARAFRELLASAPIARRVAARAVFGAVAA